MAGRKKIDLRARLYEKIDKRGSEECWPWLAYCHRGYGTISISTKGVRTKQHAIRVAYELEYGSIPPGLEIDHVCNNRLCCNPAHGEAVTHVENMKRAWRRENLADKFVCPAFKACVAADPRGPTAKSHVYRISSQRASQWTRALAAS